MQRPTSGLERQQEELLKMLDSAQISLFDYRPNDYDLGSGNANYNSAIQDWAKNPDVQNKNALAERFLEKAKALRRTLPDSLDQLSLQHHSKSKYIKENLNLLFEIAYQLLPPQSKMKAEAAFFYASTMMTDFEKEPQLQGHPFSEDRQYYRARIERAKTQANVYAEAITFGDKAIQKAAFEQLNNIGKYPVTCNPIDDTYQRGLENYIRETPVPRSESSNKDKQAELREMLKMKTKDLNEYFASDYRTYPGNAAYSSAIKNWLTTLTPSEKTTLAASFLKKGEELMGLDLGNTLLNNPDNVNLMFEAAYQLSPPHTPERAKAAFLYASTISVDHEKWSDFLKNAEVRTLCLSRVEKAKARANLFAEAITDGDEEIKKAAFSKLMPIKNYQSVCDPIASAYQHGLSAYTKQQTASMQPVKDSHEIKPNGSRNTAIPNAEFLISPPTGHDSSKTRAPIHRPPTPTSLKIPANDHAFPGQQHHLYSSRAQTDTALATFLKSKDGSSLSSSSSQTSAPIRLTTLSTPDIQAAWVTEAANKNKSLHSTLYLKEVPHDDELALLFIAKNMIDPILKELGESLQGGPNHNNSDPMIVTIGHCSDPKLQKAVADYCALSTPKLSCEIKTHHGRHVLQSTENSEQLERFRAQLQEKISKISAGLTEDPLGQAKQTHHRLN